MRRPPKHDLVLGLAIPIWAALAVNGSQIGEFVSVGVIFGAVWAFGRGLRERTDRVSALAAHAAQIELESAEREAAAAASERARIARELHDIVAHSISVVAVQTQAVRRRLGPGTEREQKDLEAVEETAREAMAEMRRLLGVLRADGDSASLAPQPGLAQLPRLLASTGAAGVGVELVETGARRELAPGVDLAAYRVIQEALTNVRKHAPGSSAVVHLTFTSAALSIRVVNDGAVVSMNGQGGYGLVGIRERVHLYGGRVDAAPQPGGGFVVEAHLPYEDRK